MHLPAILTVHDCAYALDGGTTVLQASDEAGREHEVMLVQHAFPECDPAPDELPGRLYYDGELVPMRSDLEARLLALLRAADVRASEPLADGESTSVSPNAIVLGDDIRQVLSRGPEENIRALLADMVEFVESEEYVRFAERVEQAAKTTRSIDWSSSMELTLESGRVIADATEEDIRSSIEGEDFAILEASDGTYMQCAELPEPPYGYVLEYQDGSLDQHYNAVDGPITLEHVIAAFLKYLRRDESWRSDFEWEKMEL